VEGATAQLEGTVPPCSQTCVAREASKGQPRAAGGRRKVKLKLMAIAVPALQANQVTIPRLTRERATLEAARLRTRRQVAMRCPPCSRSSSMPRPSCAALRRLYESLSLRWRPYIFLTANPFRGPVKLYLTRVPIHCIHTNCQLVNRGTRVVSA